MLAEKNPFYGKKHTDRAKENISLHFTGLMVGKSNPFFGRHHTKETITTLSEKMTGKPSPMKGVIRDDIRGDNNPAKSAEVRLKISKKRLGVPIPKLQGANHPRWKGGADSESERIRHSPEYREWRYKVFKRDNWLCVWCNEKKAYIEADHIKLFSEYPELRLDVNNGRTLCRSCHKKRHYGNKFTNAYISISP
jgi:hypothetical protein